MWRGTRRPLARTVAAFVPDPPFLPRPARISELGAGARHAGKDDAAVGAELEKTMPLLVHVRDQVRPPPP